MKLIQRFWNFVRGRRSLQKVCAWCGPKLTGSGITHGICSECYKKEMEKLDAED